MSLLCRVSEAFQYETSSTDHCNLSPLHLRTNKRARGKYNRLQNPSRIHHALIVPHHGLLGSRNHFGCRDYPQGPGSMESMFKERRLPIRQRACQSCHQPTTYIILCRLLTRIIEAIFPNLMRLAALKQQSQEKRTLCHR